jgi:hypothetical protein
MMTIVARGGGAGTTNAGQTQATGLVVTEMKARRYPRLLPALVLLALPVNRFIRPTGAPVPQQVQAEKETAGTLETETSEIAETAEIAEITEITETAETAETDPTDTIFTGTGTSLSSEVVAVQGTIEILVGVMLVALVLAKTTHIMAGIAKSNSTMEAAIVGKNFIIVSAKKSIATITGIVSETETVRKLTEDPRSHTTVTNPTLAVAVAAVLKCRRTIEIHATKQMCRTMLAIATNPYPILLAGGQINHTMQGSVINPIHLRAQACVAKRRLTTKHGISAVNLMVSVQ